MGPSYFLFYGIGTYSVLLMSWLTICIPFDIVDRTGIFSKWKLQPNAHDRTSSALLKQRALRLAFKNWAWLPFALLLATPLLKQRIQLHCIDSIDVNHANMSSLVIHIFNNPVNECANHNSVLKIFFQIVLSFILDDVCFYVYHRILHSHRFLYIHFHKMHHKFTAPFAWTSHAVHPVEMLLQSIGAMMGPLLFAMELRIFWLWLVVRQWQGVLDHVGYDLPFDILHYIPGIGGTKFHDDHHKYVTMNYASCFSIIDDVFGTSSKCTVNNNMHIVVPKKD